MNSVPFLIIILMIATVLTLLGGLIIMTRSGEKSKKLSNKFMILRVVLQALAIGLLILLAAIKPS